MKTKHWNDKNTQRVAVMGTYFSGINTLSNLLHKMDLFLGSQPDTVAESGRLPLWEDIELREICRRCYEEPDLTMKLPCQERIVLLRKWMEIQEQNKPKFTRLICGKHPILSLMGVELLEAWSPLKIICIERSDEESLDAMQQFGWTWDRTTARKSFEKLRKARETFFEQRTPQVMKLSYSDMMNDPYETIIAISRFLDHFPDLSETYYHAAHFVRKTRNDVELMNTAIYKTGERDS